MGAARTQQGIHTVILPKRRNDEVVGMLKESLGRDIIEDRSGFNSLRDELSGYFAGSKTVFDGNIDLDGASDFEKRVWSSALNIPWGQVRSYGWIARSIGMPGASRAVGGALSHNRLPMIVPCHRVTKKDGGIGGFADGLAMKRLLLKIEGISL